MGFSSSAGTSSLIAGSLVDSSWWGYIKRRVVRIFPAFWVALLATAFVIAPIVVMLSNGAVIWREWLWGEGGALSYMGSNVTLQIHQEGIMGTPSGTPAAGEWNASLWSLYWEFLCYLGLGLLGVCGVVKRKLRWVTLTAVCVLVVVDVVSFYSNPLQELLDDQMGHGLRLMMAFLCGVVLFLYSDSVKVSVNMLAFTSAFILALPFLPGVFLQTSNFALTLPLTYTVIVLGCLWKSGKFRRVDISYGMYIYAFPVQQSIVLLFGVAVSTLGMFVSAVIAGVVTSTLGYLSWILVEKPAMRVSRNHTFYFPVVNEYLTKSGTVLAFAAITFTLYFYTWVATHP